MDCCSDALGLNAQPGCSTFYSAARSVLGQAAALAGKVPLDGRTAILISGGNTDAAQFAKVLLGND